MNCLICTVSSVCKCTVVCWYFFLHMKECGKSISWLKNSRMASGTQDKLQIAGLTRPPAAPLWLFTSLPLSGLVRVSSSGYLEKCIGGVNCTVFLHLSSSLPISRSQEQVKTEDLCRVRQQAKDGRAAASRQVHGQEKPSRGRTLRQTYPSVLTSGQKLGAVAAGIFVVTDVSLSSVALLWLGWSPCIYFCTLPSSQELHSLPFVSSSNFCLLASGIAVEQSKAI